MSVCVGMENRLPFSSRQSTDPHHPRAHSAAFPPSSSSSSFPCDGAEKNQSFLFDESFKTAYELELWRRSEEVKFLADLQVRLPCLTTHLRLLFLFSRGVCTPGSQSSQPNTFFCHSNPSTLSSCYFGPLLLEVF